VCESEINRSCEKGGRAQTHKAHRKEELEVAACEQKDNDFILLCAARRSLAEGIFCRHASARCWRMCVRPLAACLD
jgi:hypothetical protein